MKTFIALLSFLIAASASPAFASEGLIIHSAEWGVGKFHRYDNQVHPYPADSAWRDYVLPAGAEMGTAGGPLVTTNSDGSYTIYFSTLDELLANVVKLSKQAHEPVSVLNVHGHGLPGGMWFPATADELGSFECYDWQNAATGSDKGNYDQYYSPVSADEVMQIRDMAENSAIHMGCVTGLPEWQSAVAKNPEFKAIFAPDAQLHFLSCVVGLGTAGQDFTQGVASLLFGASSGARVETSIDFGLGDWSMPEGMGFWDYQTDAQIDHDNQLYVADHKDREIAQKGTIRMVTSQNGKWGSTLLSQRDFMRLGFESSVAGVPVPETHLKQRAPLPTEVRLPGTRVYVPVERTSGSR